MTPFHTVSSADPSLRYLVIEQDGGFATYRSVWRDGRFVIELHTGEWFETFTAALNHVNALAGVRRVAA